MTEKPNADENRKENTPTPEKKFVEYGRRFLDVMRRMRTQLHEATLNNDQRQHLLQNIDDFVHQIAPLMIQTLMDKGGQEELKSKLSSKELDLGSTGWTTVIQKNDDMVSLNLLASFASDVLADLDIAASDDGVIIDAYINMLFREINCLPITNLREMSEAGKDAVFVAPLSAGTLLVSCLCEYLNAKYNLDLKYTTVSPEAKGTSTVVLTDMKADTFVIVDDAVEGLPGSDQTYFSTIIQVEEALRQHYGVSVTIQRGTKYNSPPEAT